MSSRQYRWTQAFRRYYGDDGPWDCHFCGRKILKKGRGSAALNRHHINEDKENNSRENLVPAHQACHSSHTRFASVTQC